MLRNAAALVRGEDPPAFRIEREEGRSPFFLTCDHAGRAIPRRLERLGLGEEVLTSHVAWDLGVAHLGRRLAARLDAFLIAQNYSRLVIDANRPPEAPDSIASSSAHVRIEANEDLSRDEARARFEQVFRPYHDRIRVELDARRARARATVLVALHTFTPIYDGAERPWHVGVLYGRDRRFAGLVLEELRRDAELVVGENEPYAVSDATDYTIVLHGEKRGLPHVELEIRQDLVAADADVESWAERLAAVLERSWAQLRP